MSRCNIINEMISEKTRQEVYHRDREKCVITDEKKDLERTPHHCFAKSEYFANDKNQSWNLVTIGREPHRFIHFAFTDENVSVGKKAAKMCREIALSRYEGKHKDKLIKIMKSRYGNNFVEN